MLSIIAPGKAISSTKNNSLFSYFSMKRMLWYSSLTEGLLMSIISYASMEKSIYLIILLSGAKMHAREMQQTHLVKSNTRT